MQIARTFVTVTELLGDACSQHFETLTEISIVAKASTLKSVTKFQVM